MIAEILEGLTRDDLTREVAGLKRELRVTKDQLRKADEDLGRALMKVGDLEVTEMRLRTYFTTAEALNATLRDEFDKARILNEHLEKENSALRHEVERLQAREKAALDC